MGILYMRITATMNDDYPDLMFNIGLEFLEALTRSWFLTYSWIGSSSNCSGWTWHRIFPDGSWHIPGLGPPLTTLDGQQWPKGHDFSIVGCPKTLLLWIDCNDQESRMNMECLSAVVSYQIAKNGYVDKSKGFLRLYI